MYASIRRYQVDPDSVDEVVRQAEEGFVPIVSGAPGFNAYYLVNAGDGVVASISLFEDQAGAEESNKLAADWVKDTLAALVTGPPEITAGEVALHTGA